MYCVGVKCLQITFRLGAYRLMQSVANTLEAVFDSRDWLGQQAKDPVIGKFF